MVLHRFPMRFDRILITLIFPTLLLFPLSGQGAIHTDSDCGCNPFAMALKSDVVKDLALLPNAGAEFGICNGWSAGFDAVYMRIMNHGRNRHWRYEGATLYARKWFGNRWGGRPLSGHHAGVYGQVAVWQFAFGGRNGYLSGNPGQGLDGHPNWGVGVEYGYSFPLSSRLNLDLTAGAGYIGGYCQKYSNRDGKYCWEKTKRIHYWGLTRIEVSLAWLIGGGL